MRRISRRCLNCHQILDELDPNSPVQINIMHETAYDCIRALARRVETLEYELMAKRLPDGLCRSSDPGPPPSSDPIPLISDFPDKK